MRIFYVVVAISMIAGICWQTYRKAMGKEGEKMSEKMRRLTWAKLR